MAANDAAVALILPPGLDPSIREQFPALAVADAAKRDADKPTKRGSVTKTGKKRKPTSANGVIVFATSTAEGNAPQRRRANSSYVLAPQDRAVVPDPTNLPWFIPSGMPVMPDGRSRARPSDNPIPTPIPSLPALPTPMPTPTAVTVTPPTATAAPPLVPLIVPLIPAPRTLPPLLPVPSFTVPPAMSLRNNARVRGVVLDALERYS